MAISKKRALQIVADLLQKYPKGPRGKKGYKRDDYELKEGFYDDVNDYRSLPQLRCGTKYFGYSEKDMLEVAMFKFSENQSSAFSTSEWDWRDAIPAIYEDLRYSSKAITSRSRRLARRVGTPVSKLVRSGKLAGCYNVQFGWGNGSDGGRVVAYGNNAADAQAVAELMCGHAFGGNRVRNTTLLSMRNVGAITKINQHTVKQIEEEIQNRLERIAKSREQIAILEAKQAVIQMFSSQQVGAMALAVCES
jgi:hypothetical protein